MLKLIGWGTYLNLLCDVKMLQVFPVLYINIDLTCENEIEL